MTTRPRLRIGRHLWPGLIAVGLFVALVTAMLRPFGDAPIGSTFGTGQGFPAGESVVANIGYALLDVGGTAIAADSFLVALILTAVLLDAALSGAILLASRDYQVGGEE